MLPIVTDLKDAPELQSAALILPDGTYGCVWNRQRVFLMQSIGGWSTKPVDGAWCSLELPFIDDWMKGFEANSVKNSLVLAPDAATAAAQYNEAQPFGEMTLVLTNHPKPRCLFQGIDLWIEFNAAVSYSKDRLFALDELIALTALLGEVIQYQKAEASGTRDSRVHRALAEQEKAKL